MEKWTAEKTLDLYRRIIEHNGVGPQATKAMEEFAELIHALCKAINEVDYTKADSPANRALEDHVAEEMADAQIMWQQLALIFSNSEAVSAWIGRKLDRLEERLNDEG